MSRISSYLVENIGGIGASGKPNSQWFQRREDAIAEVKRRLTTSDDEVLHIFNGLKPRERALLWLAYVEEDNHTQIAETLGVGRSSVKVLLARARTRLRGLLAEKKHLTET